MPVVTGTEPWGRRILNTQLASWAELRHDTILYVKQSYTSGVSCAFPDAYVDPYPEAFAELQRFADYATANVLPVAARSQSATDQAMLAAYFAQLSTVAKMLHDMAQAELTGAAFSADQMAFINAAVTVQQECGGATANGWYPNLVFGDPTTFDPTIADVHTQPTDAGGNVIGRILHVGTGYARLMVVTANTCAGPRAYAGLASSYYETITQNFDRLTDDRWQANFGANEPPDVSWVSDILK
jgi:hypothetical protein